MNTPHESRLNRAVRMLLQTQRVAALGTLDADGKPFVSMVPFGIDRQAGHFIIHTSLLAPHTRNLLGDPVVSLMVMQAETPQEPVHALHRLSTNGTAHRLPPGSPTWQTARSAYLARFPEAQAMTELGDFSFFALHVSEARQVAGFGAARRLNADEMASLLKWQD